MSRLLSVEHRAQIETQLLSEWIDMEISDVERQAHSTDANLLADEFIRIAEGIFGAMCSRWAYGGVVLNDRGPHLLYSYDPPTVCISLSLRTIKDPFQRDFQLAHEVCHLLYPSAEPDYPSLPPTLVINEGISTYFSLVVVEALHGKSSMMDARENLAQYSPGYFSAQEQVSALLQQDIDAIKKIRVIQPMINKVTKEDLCAAGLGLTSEAINALVAVF